MLSACSQKALRVLEVLRVRRLVYCDKWSDVRHNTPTSGNDGDTVMFCESSLGEGVCVADIDR